MKVKGKNRAATYYLILLVIFLLGVNFTLGYLLTRHSSRAMISLMRGRMLDISNTAADMLDGDVLETLTPEDEGTPGYERVMRTLAYFQDNIELEYIYCIRNMGNRNFVFGLDPTVEDPGEFGQPIVYTDALYAASLGTPAVDEIAYEDEWGTFYSAYSPVFNSRGEVAGIVAVDFSSEWYEKQLATLRRTTAVVGLVSMIAGGAIVVSATARGRRRLRRVNIQMNDLAGNVEELLEEIGKIPGRRRRKTVTKPSVRRPEGEDIDALGEKILSMQQELKTQIELVREQAYHDGLTGVLNTASYLDTVRELDSRIRAGEAAFAVAVIDLNSLKNINDDIGHEAGDIALTDTATALTQVFGEDNVYRIGGDEYIAIMKTAGEPEMKRYFAMLDETLMIMNYTKKPYGMPLALSKGYAVLQEGDEDFRTVFRRADQMMYRDKASYYTRFGDRRKNRQDGGTEKQADRARERE